MVRVITAIGLWGSLLGVVLGTNEASARNAVAGRALLPSAEALDRLNLRQEWAIQLPIEVNRDRIMQVQTIDDQLFVQTRTGLLFAIDVHTGRIQWQKQLGNGEYAVTHPAAANSRFVYVTHVTRLYTFHRYSGVVEFEVDLGSEPSAGLAADNTGVYCILGLRSGSSAAHRITVYNLIQPIAVPDQQRKGTSDLQRQGIKEENQKPLNELMQRYAPGSMRSYNIEQEIPLLRPQVPPGAEPTGGYTGSRTPSLSPLPRITPPYTLSNENYTPSLNVLPSLRQPYQLRNEANKYLQSTPSIGTIPPSVAAALALIDLRPQPIRPAVRWEYGLRGRVEFPPLLTPQRVWIFGLPRYTYALNKKDRTVELYDSLTEPFTAAPVQAEDVIYLPLRNTLLAVSGQRGSTDSGVDLLWRTPVSGAHNHSPYVTPRYVYASGDETGIICLDRRTGQERWRSDPSINIIIGANEEFVYARDKLGNLYIFDAGRATDIVSGRARPLASLPLLDYDHNVVNTVSDRLYLATHNGLLLCLRDKASKYVQPRPIWPAPWIQAPPAKEPAKDDKKPADDKK